MRTAVWVLLAWIVSASLCPSSASADEICRFTGTTDYDGRAVATTNVAASNGMTTVDVVVTFDATMMYLFHMRYLVQEISTWRAGKLESVALNTRYLVDDQIIRQQWDVFQRGPDGLQGRRVQAKTLAEFRQRHPGFVDHWSPATFGQPWLQDYPSASSERRADLDLKGPTLPPVLRSPLAMAFYWVRWLPRTGQDVSVFLPGFKRDRLVNLAIAGRSSAGGMEWSAPLRYPALSEQPASTAAALVSSDRRLSRLSFELHEPRGSARGLIRQDGCQGAVVTPVDRP